LTAAGGILYCKDGSNFYYYHYDGNGNVTSVTDGDGKEVAIYEYDSFGNLLTEAGSLSNGFKLSTKQADKRGRTIPNPAASPKGTPLAWQVDRTCTAVAMGIPPTTPLIIQQGDTPSLVALHVE